MKYLLLLITLFTISLQAQDKKIIDFLNKDLKWEVKNQFENQDRIERFDTLVVVQPFEIKNGMLSITTKRRKGDYSEDGTYTQSYITVKQEVAIKDIVKLSKDMNVLFITKPNAVKIYENGVQTGTDSLFFLQLCCSNKYSEIWASDLLALFKKAGYTIEMDNWYD